MALGSYLCGYSVTDPQGQSGLGTLIIHVYNDPPTGLSLNRVGIPFNNLRPLRYPLDPAWYEEGCLSFTDPNGDPLTFSLGRYPTKGLVDLTSAGANGRYSVTLLYTVNRDEVLKTHRGTEPYVDRFTVVAEDPFGARAATQVEVTVNVANTPPTCVADAASTKSGTAVAINVVANDTDPDSDVLTLTAATAPAHGTTVVSAGKVTYTPSAGFFGQDAFTYTVSDGYGGTATGQVTVTVTDAEPPVFAWSAQFSDPLPNDAAVCSAVVAWVPPAVGVDVTDNVGVVSLTSTPSPGSTFPVGSTTVTYTAKDAAGNEASFSFAVDVEDAEAPALHDVPANIVTAAVPGETTKVVSWTPATASDNCGVATLDSSHSPGEAFPIGTTLVTTTAVDIHGNAAEATFSITVNGPLSIVAHDVEVTTPRDDGEHVTFSVGTTGGCPPVTVECDPESGSFFDLGVTTVDVTATDACGTVVSDSFDVTVIHEAENQAPIARDDRPPDMTTPWIVVRVLLNDEDLDGDEISLISIASPPCGDAMPSESDPNAIYYAAAGCDAYKGKTISFDYEIEDEHGARARATVYLRIPDDIVLPRAAAGE